MAANGKLLTDTIATLRVSALGFVIGCAAASGLAVLPAGGFRKRATQAIEPFILASMGISEIRADAPGSILLVRSSVIGRRSSW